VVFMPPPVPAGEAPINISIIVKNLEAVVISGRDRVLNPAVLGVTDWNKEASIFVEKLNGFNVLGLLYSNRNISKAPAIIKTTSW